ncbi:hypothetical protein ACF0H5_013436 [Mactra antiquata]
MGHTKVINEFSITLNSRPSSYGPVYMSRDVISGHIRLELLQHLSLTSITITIKGRGYVHWTDQKLRGAGEPRFKDTHHHSAYEDYFEHSLLLYGQGSKEKPDKLYLPAGKYTYPFQCQLPTPFPCSFEGEHGYVRYWVRATIDKGREIIHKTKLLFTVINPLDLTHVPDSNVPVQETEEKSLCCFCCLSGPITASLSVQKRGYVPGEPIRFAVEISNLSRRQMGCCSVELKMSTLFKTPTSCRNTTQQVCKVKRDRKIGRGECISWFSDQLTIPPLPPSCLIGCSLISIKYTLELRVDPVGPAFDLTLPLEIIVGTHPHRIRHDLHPMYSSIPPCDMSSRSSQHSGETDRTSSNRADHAPSNRPPIGVPVLPMRSGQAISNAGNPHLCGSQYSRQLHAMAPSRDQNRPPSRDQNRPPSRASTAPSTASTSSVHTTRVSAVFAESVFGHSSLRFEEDAESTGRVKFVPLYPLFIWR